MTNPDPVPPPFLDRVVIETTDGSTRDAIPATESGARSMELVDETMFALSKKVPPEELTPRKPPMLPASKAINTAVPRELFLEV